ncbi:MAG: hypothetical protein IKB01_00620 [Lachnospiraceae bacterium]|nr:hypothetical protein [Lachnospiraceae bacterium]
MKMIMIDLMTEEKYEEPLKDLRDYTKTVNEVCEKNQAYGIFYVEVQDGEITISENIQEVLSPKQRKEREKQLANVKKQSQIFENVLYSCAS